MRFEHASNGSAGLESGPLPATLIPTNGASSVQP